MFKKLLLVTCLLAAGVMVISCAPAPAPAPEAPAPADAALQMIGLTNAAWSLADLQALPQSQSEFTNKEGETTIFSGVRFADLLAAAGVEDYAGVNMIAADDYSIEIDQERLDACEDCLVALMEDGSLLAVMPGFEGRYQVRDLVTLEVK